MIKVITETESNETRPAVQKKMSREDKELVVHCMVAKIDEQVDKEFYSRMLDRRWELFRELSYEGFIKLFEEARQLAGV